MQSLPSIFIAGCLILISIATPLKAQVLPADSLALVDFYNATDGPNWNNDNNWLTGSVGTWFGIEVSGNRVSQVNLPNNNLSGQIPASFNNLTALTQLVISMNAIQSIPSLSNLNILGRLVCNDNQLTSLPEVNSSLLTEVLCQNNRLDFGDLEGFQPQGIPLFIYAPQAKIGQERSKYAISGTNTSFFVPTGGTNNEYLWYKDGTPFGLVPSTDPVFEIATTMASDLGDYFVEVTNPGFPNLTLQSEDIHLLFPEFDVLGGPYIPNQLIMEFVDDASPEIKDSLLNYYQAIRLDSCLCGVLELWELPDTSFLPEGEIIIGIEGIKEDAMSKSEIEESGFNYVLSLLDGGAVPTSYVTRSAAMPRPANEGDLTVAVIDVGVDYTHPSLTPFIWQNENEVLNQDDDDGNCLPDDVQGYNFTGKNTDPIDAVNGHGTHVAGIVLKDVPADSDIRLINLKSHDDEGFGVLFDALCGIYYAADQEAKVINLSWGYTGLPSPLLESAIFRAGGDCGALVVASAGNDGSDNDQTPHYPSSFELDNLISVAALNLTEDELLPESNYGVVSVDLAAPGERILSTLPGNEFGFKKGTSMAAAAVSNAAIQLYETNPEVTYLNVKQALLSTVMQLPALDVLATGGKLDLPAALTFIANAEPDTSCSMITSAIEARLLETPEIRIFPQPFRETVTIGVPSSFEPVTMLIFDAFGQQVYYKKTTAPDGQLIWNGEGNGGQSVPPGMYFFKIKVADQWWSGKLMRN